VSLSAGKELTVAVNYSHIKGAIMTVDAKAMCPKVPDTLKLEGTKLTFPLSKFSDDELREVGFQYTEELITIAKQQRKAIIAEDAK
jgi:hypothetical protein